MIYTARYPSDSLGELLIASDGENIIGLWLAGQKYFARTISDELEGESFATSSAETTSNPDIPVLAQSLDWLDRYFAGKQPTPNELPLAPRGSKFAQRVWQKLVEIPYGQLRTYGDIAKELEGETGRRASAQAVGGAVGHNPISIIIPCHRVVGASGSLTGYAGGIDKKVHLLEHEGVDMSGLFVPKKGTAL